MSKAYPQMPSLHRRKRPLRTLQSAPSQSSSYSALFWQSPRLYLLPLSHLLNHRRCVRLVSCISGAFLARCVTIWPGCHFARLSEERNWVSRRPVACGSTPALIRPRSPVVRISSRLGSGAACGLAFPVSTSADRIGCRFLNHLRQRQKACSVICCCSQNCFTDRPCAQVQQPARASMFLGSVFRLHAETLCHRPTMVPDRHSGRGSSDASPKREVRPRIRYATRKLMLYELRREAEVRSVLESDLNQFRGFPDRVCLRAPAVAVTRRGVSYANKSCTTCPWPPTPDKRASSP